MSAFVKPAAPLQRTGGRPKGDRWLTDHVVRLPNGFYGFQGKPGDRFKSLSTSDPEEAKRRADHLLKGGEPNWPVGKAASARAKARKPAVVPVRDGVQGPIIGEATVTRKGRVAVADISVSPEMTRKIEKAMTPPPEVVPAKEETGLVLASSLTKADADVAFGCVAAHIEKCSECRTAGGLGARVEALCLMGRAFVRRWERLERASP